MLGKNKALQVIEKLRREYPDAGTMLRFNGLFQLLVAVVLSAQSTDNQVNRVTGQLFKKYPAPADLAAASPEALEEIIRPVGIYRSKARNLRELARIIQERHQGMVPDNLEELIRLPGVGRKSANVILSVGFGKPGLGVDTHVQRVALRIGLVNTKTPEMTETGLKELLPPEMWGKTHHLLIFHGRNVCRARKPDCERCSIEDYCEKHIDNEKR